MINPTINDLFLEYRNLVIKSLHGRQGVSGEVKQDPNIALAAAMLVLADTQLKMRDTKNGQ